MKTISDVMSIFYFSGTGNSKYIAELFCSQMKEQKVLDTVDALPNVCAYSIEDKRDFSYLITSSGTIAFCYPVYGSLVPRIMREFAAKYASELTGKNLIIFCTQLLFSGDGACAFYRLFPKDSVTVIYAEHFFMPNSICNAPFFKVTNGSENKTYLDSARKKMLKTCADIKKGRVFRRGFNPLSRFLGLMQNTSFPAVERRNVYGVRVDSDCISCGVCVRRCPMHNLELDTGGVRSKGNCTLCYRCVNLCPQKAITVLFHKKPVTQYGGIVKEFL